MAEAGERSFERLTTPAGVTHQPALDGLRGVAIVVVVLFHLDVGWLRGGFLSLTLFFTLSGFLIGTIVLHELTATGRFSLRRFWARRARRLLPGALVTLAAIGIARSVSSHLAATSGTDLVAAAVDVANWHFIADHRSYADLFTGPSAALHFWSLSIEEQFYLAGGLVVWLLARRRPARPALVIGTGAAVIAAVSWSLPAIAGLGIDRTYYGTDTRAGELMVGVAMAAWCASPDRRAAIAHRRWLAPVGLLAAAASAALWATQHTGTAGLRRGLLPLAAMLSGVVILAALAGGGPLARACRARPLVAAGRVSYAWYLVHWPVIVVADQLSADRSVARTVGLLAGTLLVAGLLTSAVERPVRRRRLRGRPLAAAFTAVVALIAATVAIGARPSPASDLLAGLDADAAALPAPSPTLHAGSSGDAGPSGLPRLMPIGDSIAVSLVLATGAAEVAPAYFPAMPATDIGCGIALSPWPPDDDPTRCDDPVGRLAAAAAENHATVVVALTCQWELLDQALPDDAGDDGTVRAPGDPVFDRYVADRFAAVVDGLRRAGVERVLWARCPHFGPAASADGVPPELRDARVPGRVDALNAVIDALAAGRDDVVVLPFDRWVNARLDDTTIRPDGAHFAYEGHNPAADELVREIGEALAGSGPAGAA